MRPYCKDNYRIISALKSRRIELGISLREIASACGLYPNSIEQFLNPNNSPKMDNLVMVGETLGVGFSTNTSTGHKLSAYALVEHLAMVRKDQEISTRELATMTGITQPSISNILSHKIMPTLNTYLLIGEALDVDLEMYFED